MIYGTVGGPSVSLGRAAVRERERKRAMDSSFGAALDASAAGPTSFQIYVADLASQGGQAALIAALALLLIMVLVQVFKPAGSEETVYPDRSPAQTLPSEADRRKRVLVPAGPLAARATDNAPLVGRGLSATDVVALAALRRRIQTGQVAEGPTASARLAFARWLAEHGKLEG